MTEDEHKRLVENHGGELAIGIVWVMIGLVFVICEPFHMLQIREMEQELRSKPPIHEAKPYHVIQGNDTLHMDEYEWKKWMQAYNRRIRTTQMQTK